MAKADMQTAIGRWDDIVPLFHSARESGLVPTLIETADSTGHPVMRYEGPREALLDFLMEHYFKLVEETPSEPPMSKEERIKMLQRQMKLLEAALNDATAEQLAELKLKLENET